MTARRAEKSGRRTPKTELQSAKSVFAKKSFGQNFLVDKNYVAKIIAALDPQKGETIVEIGAGRGALTESLVESGARVFAVELDRDLIPLLQEKFKGFENFNLIEADALQIEFADLNPKSEILNPQSLRLVANLPYYISTAILQRLIEQRAAFSEMVLMFQREVVQRITARAGEAERGFLTVLVEAYLNAEKLFDVPPSAFRPAPKVWSAMLRLRPQESGEIEDEKLFREILSAGFRQKRKTIFNNLKNAGAELSGKIEAAGGVGKILEKSNVEPSRRAETLTLGEWKSLTGLLT